MKRFVLALVLGTISVGTHASLVSRLGGEAVYDTDLNITWLANANAGAGSGFDDGLGLMTWENANAWAASLTVSGVGGWRLPTTLQPDPSCDSQTGDVPPPSFGFNCTGSEMGHLFYNELSGIANSSILSSGDPDLALFPDFLDITYWSSTPYSNSEFAAWAFRFLDGFQMIPNKTTTQFAWAVHSGDIFAPVPIPATVWLFGSALGFLGWMRRKAT